MRERKSVAKTFLSSYVLATLCRSRQFIYVDPSIISGVVALLESRRLPSGQFKALLRSYNTRRVNTHFHFILLIAGIVISVFI